jgi:hypothetical protein
MAPTSTSTSYVTPTPAYMAPSGTTTYVTPAPAYMAPATTTTVVRTP